jgi:hypothetical protein
MYIFRITVFKNIRLTSAVNEGVGPWPSSQVVKRSRVLTKKKKLSQVGNRSVTIWWLFGLMPTKRRFSRFFSKRATADYFATHCIAKHCQRTTCISKTGTASLALAERWLVLPSLYVRQNLVGCCDEPRFGTLPHSVRHFKPWIVLTEQELAPNLRTTSKVILTGSYFDAPACKSAGLVKTECLHLSVLPFSRRRVDLAVLSCQLCLGLSKLIIRLCLPHVTYNDVAWLASWSMGAAFIGVVVAASLVPFTRYYLRTAHT